MLTFEHAAHGALVPARIASGPADLRVFAVRAADGNLRVCLINQHPRRAVRATVAPGRRFAGASVLRLAGPAIDATAGVTFAGASVDDRGQWAPARQEPADVVAANVTLDVAAASAALVVLRA